MKNLWIFLLCSLFALPFVGHAQETLPDLTVETIEYRSSYQGQKYVLYIDFCNRGTLATFSTEGKVSLAGKTQTVQLGQILPGECRAGLVFLNDQARGDVFLGIYPAYYDVEVTVDPENKVEEKNERNNGQKKSEYIDAGVVAMDKSGKPEVVRFELKNKTVDGYDLYVHSSYALKEREYLYVQCKDTVKKSYPNQPFAQYHEPWAVSKTSPVKVQHVLKESDTYSCFLAITDRNNIPNQSFWGASQAFTVNQTDTSGRPHIQKSEVVTTPQGEYRALLATDYVLKKGEYFFAQCAPSPTLSSVQPGIHTPWAVSDRSPIYVPEIFQYAGLYSCTLSLTDNINFPHEHFWGTSAPVSFSQERSLRAPITLLSLTSSRARLAFTVSGDLSAQESYLASCTGYDEDGLPVLYYTPWISAETTSFSLPVDPLLSRYRCRVGITSKETPSLKMQWGLSLEKEVEAPTTEAPVSSTVEETPAPSLVSTGEVFPDTGTGTLIRTAALFLKEEGVISGFPDGTFGTEKMVNRAEAAKFLLLARYGDDFVPAGTSTSSFTDVVAGAWYLPFVEEAARLGIIEGYKDGTFRPEQSVNTAEFLKMLMKTFGVTKTYTHTYSDVRTQDWFSSSAGFASTYRLFPERSLTLLLPAQKLTRGEVAVALYTYLHSAQE